MRIIYGGLGGQGLNQAIAAAFAEMDVSLIAAVEIDSTASLIIATDTLTQPAGILAARPPVNGHRLHPLAGVRAV